MLKVQVSFFIFWGGGGGLLIVTNIFGVNLSDHIFWEYGADNTEQMQGPNLFSRKNQSTPGVIHSCD